MGGKIVSPAAGSHNGGAALLILPRYLRHCMGENRQIVA